MAAQQSEFGEDRRRQVVAARIPRVRVLWGELVAEIILERRMHPSIVHCVVQRQGSPEVLFLEQFYSQEEAEEAAEIFMANYARKHRRAKTQIAVG